MKTGKKRTTLKTGTVNKGREKKERAKWETMKQPAISLESSNKYYKKEKKRSKGMRKCRFWKAGTIFV